MRHRSVPSRGAWLRRALALVPALLIAGLACSSDGGTAVVPGPTATARPGEPTSAPQSDAPAAPAPSATPAAPAATVRAAGASPTNTVAAPAPTATAVPQRRVGSAVGDLAPDFTVRTVTGETVVLSEVLAQGKSVLLYFFASW